jgi:tetrahydromethanopterin S-methyltransferase subunit F
MLIGALARLVLPEERAGMLASRRRFIDVVTLAGLAIGLLVAGLLLPSSS